MQSLFNGVTSILSVDCGETLAQCWINNEGGPTLNHNWANVCADIEQNIISWLDQTI